MVDKFAKNVNFPCLPISEHHDPGSQVPDLYEVQLRSGQELVIVGDGDVNYTT